MFNFIRKLNNNPVFIKDWIINGRDRKIAGGRGAEISMLTYFFLSIITIAGIAGLINPGIFGPTAQNFWFSLIVFLLGISMTYQVAGISFLSFTREKTAKTYPQLLSTALSPSEILQGKIWAAVYPPMREFTFFYPWFFTAGILNHVKWYYLILVYFSTFVSAIIVAVLGIYCSFVASGTNKAGRKMSLKVRLSIGVFMGLVFLAFVAPKILPNIVVRNVSFLVLMGLALAVIPSNLWFFPFACFPGSKVMANIIMGLPFVFSIYISLGFSSYYVSLRILREVPQV